MLPKTCTFFAHVQAQARRQRKSPLIALHARCVERLGDAVPGKDTRESKVSLWHDVFTQIKYAGNDYKCTPAEDTAAK